MKRLSIGLILLMWLGPWACQPDGTTPAQSAQEEAPAAQVAAPSVPSASPTLPTGESHYPTPMEVHRCLQLAKSGASEAADACAKAARLAPGHPEVKAALEQLKAPAS